jgi:hypothetical protein
MKKELARSHPQLEVKASQGFPRILSIYIILWWPILVVLAAFVVQDGLQKTRKGFGVYGIDLSCNSKRDDWRNTGPRRISFSRWLVLLAKCVLACMIAQLRLTTSVLQGRAGFNSKTLTRSLLSVSRPHLFLNSDMVVPQDLLSSPKMVLDPGTALAIVGLALNAVKDLHSYYVLWKGRDKDVEEIRRQLTWIMNVFQSIEATLQHDNLNSTQKQMICDSIEACQGIMTSSKEN